MTEEKEKSQPTKDFEEIWDEYHDPIKKERKRIEKNREAKSKLVKEELGL